MHDPWLHGSPNFIPSIRVDVQDDLQKLVNDLQVSNLSINGD